MKYTIFLSTINHKTMLTLYEQVYFLFIYLDKIMKSLVKCFYPYIK